MKTFRHQRRVIFAAWLTLALLSALAIPTSAGAGRTRAAAVNSCTLLTTAQLNSAFNVTFRPGTMSSNKFQCNYYPQNDKVGVTVGYLPPAKDPASYYAALLRSPKGWQKVSLKGVQAAYYGGPEGKLEHTFAVYTGKVFFLIGYAHIPGPTPGARNQLLALAKQVLAHLKH